MPIRSVRAAIAVAALLLPASAAADSPKRAFQVEVRGTHVVEWTYQSDRELPECGTWSKGSGRHVTDFRTAKPEPYAMQFLELPGRDPLVTWLPRDQRVHPFEVTREGRWDAHVPPVACSPCGPNSEFGECGPPIEQDGETVACPQRELAGRIVTAYLTPSDQHVADDDLAPPFAALRVVASVPLGDELDRCLPDRRGQTLTESEPLPVDLPARQLARMKRGDAKTFKGTRTLQMAFDERAGIRKQRDGSCGPMGGTGLNECVSTRVEVVVRRVR